VGRPLSHFVSDLERDPLGKVAEEVLETLVAKETEVMSKEGQCYLSRISPYRTVDNIVDGVVITFVDITERKRAIAQQQSLEYIEGIVETVREPLVVLDAELKVLSANRSFYANFKVQPEVTEGKLLYELGNGQWNIPRLRELLEKILSESASFQDFVVDRVFPEIGYKKMLLNARRIHQAGIVTDTILLAIEDITARQ
jgi:two-component system CheB/CheR fusion protein